MPGRDEKYDIKDAKYDVKTAAGRETKQQPAHAVQSLPLTAATLLPESRPHKPARPLKDDAYEIPPITTDNSEAILKKFYKEPTISDYTKFPKDFDKQLNQLLEGIIRWSKSLTRSIEIFKERLKEYRQHKNIKGLNNAKHYLEQIYLYFVEYEYCMLHVATEYPSPPYNKKIIGGYIFVKPNYPVDIKSDAKDSKSNTNGQLYYIEDKLNAKLIKINPNQNEAFEKLCLQLVGNETTVLLDKTQIQALITEKTNHQRIDKNLPGRLEIQEHLNTRITVCGPGVLVYLADLAERVTTQESLTKLLYQYRREIVEVFGSQHSVEYKLPESLEMHIFIALYNAMHKADWGMSHHHDQYIHLAMVGASQIEQFHKEFLQRYTPGNIIDLFVKCCIQKISTLIKKHGLTKDNVLAVKAQQKNLEHSIEDPWWYKDLSFSARINECGESAKSYFKQIGFTSEFKIRFLFDPNEFIYCPENLRAVILQMVQQEQKFFHADSWKTITLTNNKKLHLFHTSPNETDTRLFWYEDEDGNPSNFELTFTCLEQTLAATQNASDKEQLIAAVLSSTNNHQYLVSVAPLLITMLLQVGITDKQHFSAAMLGRLVLVLAQNQCWDLIKNLLALNLPIDLNTYCDPTTNNYALHLAVIYKQGDLVSAFCHRDANPLFINSDKKNALYLLELLTTEDAKSTLPTSMYDALSELVSAEQKLSPVQKGQALAQNVSIDPNCIKHYLGAASIEFEHYHPQLRTTPLQSFVLSNKISINDKLGLLIVLCKRGASPDLQGGFTGKTALQFAIDNGDAFSAAIIITHAQAYGAFPPDALGKTLLLLTEFRGPVKSQSYAWKLIDQIIYKTKTRIQFNLDNKQQIPLITAIINGFKIHKYHSLLSYFVSILTFHSNDKLLNDDTFLNNANAEIVLLYLCAHARYAEAISFIKSRPHAISGTTFNDSIGENNALMIAVKAKSTAVNESNRELVTQLQELITLLCTSSCNPAVCNQQQLSAYALAMKPAVDYFTLKLFLNTNIPSKEFIQIAESLAKHKDWEILKDFCNIDNCYDRRQAVIDALSVLQNHKRWQEIIHCTPEIITLSNSALIIINLVADAVTNYPIGLACLTQKQTGRLLLCFAKYSKWEPLLIVLNYLKIVTRFNIDHVTYCSTQDLVTGNNALLFVLQAKYAAQDKNQPELVTQLTQLIELLRYSDLSCPNKKSQTAFGLALDRQDIPTIKIFIYNRNLTNLFAKLNPTQVQNILSRPIFWEVSEPGPARLNVLYQLSRKYYFDNTHEILELTDRNGTKLFDENSTETLLSSYFQENLLSQAIDLLKTVKDIDKKLSPNFKYQMVFLTITKKAILSSQANIDYVKMLDECIKLLLLNAAPNLKLPGCDSIVDTIKVNDDLSTLTLFALSNYAKECFNEFETKTLLFRLLTAKQFNYITDIIFNYPAMFIIDDLEFWRSIDAEQRPKIFDAFYLKVITHPELSANLRQVLQYQDSSGKPLFNLTAQHWIKPTTIDGDHVTIGISHTDLCVDKEKPNAKLADKINLIIQHNQLLIASIVTRIKEGKYRSATIALTDSIQNSDTSARSVELTILAKLVNKHLEVQSVNAVCTVSSLTDGDFTTRRRGETFFIQLRNDLAGYHDMDAISELLSLVEPMGPPLATQKQINQAVVASSKFSTVYTLSHHYSVRTIQPYTDFLPLDKLHTVNDLINASCFSDKALPCVIIIRNYLYSVPQSDILLYEPSAIYLFSKNTLSLPCNTNLVYIPHPNCADKTVTGKLVSGTGAINLPSHVAELHVDTTASNAIVNTGDHKDQPPILGKPAVAVTITIGTIPIAGIVGISANKEPTGVTPILNK